VTLRFLIPNRHSSYPRTTALTAPQAITGLGTAYTTGYFLGPLAAVGFTVGSCIGYVLASLFYFRITMEQALAAFDTYPRLMMLHMASNYTTYGFEKLRMETEQDKVAFQRRLNGSLMLRCFLLSSYHTAAPAIDVSGAVLVHCSARADASLLGDYD
jgi:hypothetical protein